MADFVPKIPLENTFSQKLHNEPVLRIYEKKSSTFPGVVWAEEPKNSLRFEIRPSYDGVPEPSNSPSDGQSSCTQIGYAFGGAIPIVRGNCESHVADNHDATNGVCRAA